MTGGPEGAKFILDVANKTEAYRALQTEAINNPILTFEFRFVTFQYDWEVQKFIAINFDTTMSGNDFYDKFGAGHASQNDYLSQKVTYGENAIRIPVKPIPRLLVDEVLNPFYIF